VLEVINVDLIDGDSYQLGWCWQREKSDWQEGGKFDCQLGQTIFIFLLSLVNFHKTLASGQKIKF